MEPNEDLGQSVGAKETEEMAWNVNTWYATKYGEKLKFSAIRTTNYIDKLFSFLIFSLYGSLSL